MKPKDPYLYENYKILRNNLNLTDAGKLEDAEALITQIKLFDIDQKVTGQFDYAHLMAVHAYIFGDIFAWAGQERYINIYKGEEILGGDTVQYSSCDEIKNHLETALEKLTSTSWETLAGKALSKEFAKQVAELWRIHPFREGNTRTVITFAAQYAQARGFAMDKELLQTNSSYVRNALVVANDGEFGNIQFLSRIFHDCIQRGNQRSAIDRSRIETDRQIADALAYLKEIDSSEPEAHTQGYESALVLKELER